jgi:hypothetical protein
MVGKIRIIAATATLGLVALVPGLAAATPGKAPPTPTLVRTHVFHPGPPTLDARGKPQPSVANCSPDDPSQYLDAPAYTGFTSTIDDRDAHFNAATTPNGLVDPVGAFQAAFDAWSVTGAPDAPDFTVTTAGPVVTAATANRHTDLLFGRAQGNAIAVTYTWRWSDGKYESDTVFNSKVPWVDISTANLDPDGCNETVVKYDLQNIAVHEFGHIFGLNHPAGDRFATMYQYGYTGETLKRTLATSDAAGIQALY